MSSSESGFQADLTAILETCCTFPKKRERADAPIPLEDPVDPKVKEVLERASSASTIEYYGLGSPSTHLTMVHRCLWQDLAARFHRDEPDRRIYQAREEAEKQIRERIEDPQVVMLLGTTGSGKSTLIGKIVNDNGRCFVYVNLARETFGVYGKHRNLEHPKYSDHDLDEYQKASLDVNIGQVLLESFCRAANFHLPPSKFDLHEVIHYIKTSDLDKEIVILFDDVDVLPLFVQKTVLQLAISLNRSLQVPVVFAQRFSNASRLILEGAGADPTAEVRLTPKQLSPKETEHILTVDQLLQIFNRRLSVLAESKAVHEYFLKWHRSPYEYFFPNGFEDFVRVSETHISYLLRDCELFYCCNFSVRFGLLTVSNIISSIIIGTNRRIKARELFQSGSADQLRLRLRDSFLDEVFKPSTGTKAQPYLFDTRMYDDSGDPFLRISPELRMLEIVHYAEEAAEESGTPHTGVPFTTLLECLKECFPEIEMEDLERLILSLTVDPRYGDPLCVRTPGEDYRSSEVQILPAGRYFAVRLASYADVIARSYEVRRSVPITSDPLKRIEVSILAIKAMLETWYETDQQTLRKLSKQYAPAKVVSNHHYLKRAVASLKAYTISLSSTYIANSQREALVKSISSLEIRL